MQVETFLNGELTGVPSKTTASKAPDLPRHADVVVIAAGYSSDSEGEGGDRTLPSPTARMNSSLTLPPPTAKTIVAVISGCNVDSTAWIDRVPSPRNLVRRSGRWNYPR